MRSQAAASGGNGGTCRRCRAVGDEVSGKVSRIMGYGLFLDLEGGLRAMLHVDEVATKPGEEGREPNVRAMFKEGDELKVRRLCCYFIAGCVRACMHGSAGGGS